MTKSRDWESRFGALRRKKDRAILAECERAIASEPRDACSTPLWRPEPLEPEMAASDARRAIARAFGRPAR
jgi:hypothetical protein